MLTKLVGAAQTERKGKCVQRPKSAKDKQIKIMQIEDRYSEVDKTTIRLAIDGHANFQVHNNPLYSFIDWKYVCLINEPMD